MGNNKITVTPTKYNRLMESARCETLLREERDALRAENATLEAAVLSNQEGVRDLNNTVLSLRADNAAALEMLRRLAKAQKHTCKHLCPWKDACETGCLVSSNMNELDALLKRMGE